MKEIKFRGYDKKNLFMYYFDPFFVNSSKLPAQTIREHKKGFESLKSIDFNDFEIMQYTGLKDKNGKEIYEGDIIKGKNTIDADLISQVEHQSIGFRNGFYLPIFAIGLSEGVIRDLQIEIIGNIYQNPELIAMIWNGINS